MKKLLCLLLVLCVTLPMSACASPEGTLPVGGGLDIGGLFEDLLSPVRDLTDSVGDFFDGLFSGKDSEEEPGDWTEDLYDPNNPPLVYDTEETEGPENTDPVEEPYPGADEPVPGDTDASVITKTLPFQPTFTNGAPGEEDVRVTFQPATITFSGPDEILNPMSSLSIVIDLAEVTGDKTWTIRIPIAPDGLTLADGEVTVTVSLEWKNVTSRNVTTHNIEVIPPKGGSYELGYRIENGLAFHVSGPRHLVDAVEPADLAAVIDLSTYPTSTEGSLTVPIQVQCAVEGVQIGASTIVVHFNIRPTLYLYTAHDTEELPELLATQLSSEGVSVRKTDSLSGIPANKNTVLLLHDPKEDLTEAESDALVGYLYRGGRLLLVTDYRRCGGEEQEMPHLAALTKAMGLSAEAGIVVEVARSSYYVAPNMLLPLLVGDGPAKSFPAGRHLFLMTNAHGIRMDSGAKAKAEPLLETTAQAFLKEKITVSGFYNQAPTDPVGTFAVAATSQLGDARFVWFGSPSVLKEQENTISQEGNFRLFLASLFWTMEK